MVMEWWNFLVVKLHTHVEAATLCATTGVHTLTCCSHIFCAQRDHCVLRTSSCVSHTHGSRSWKRCLLHAHVVPLDFSHVSPVSVCCFCTVTSRPTLPTHPSTRSGRTFPAQKRGSSALRTRTSSLATWPRPSSSQVYEPKEFDKITFVHVDTPPINDPDHNMSDFSKTTRENTGHSVLNPLFCTFLIGDFALQRESKESMLRETVARQKKRGKRRFCDQRCRVDVKEKSTEQY